MKIGRILFTIDDANHGNRIAAELLERHWIACAQVTGPIQSHYHWKGKVEHTQEWRYELKTTAEGKDLVAEYVLTNHTYDVPEILAETIESVNPSYSQWVEDECQGL